MSKVEHITIAEKDDGMRLDRWLKSKLPGISYGQLAKIIRTGQVRIDGHRTKASERIASGQTVRLPPVRSRESLQKTARAAVSDADQMLLRSMIILETADLIALNKVPGLPVQGGSGTTRHLDGMLGALIEGTERPRLVHRLDKDTSGVLVLAKNRKMAQHLTKSFASRTTRKLYWALTVGVPQLLRGQIRLKMDKRPGQSGEKMEVSESGKKSETFYTVIDKAARTTAWIALMPMTGRTHQLRLHLAHMGTPVVGDGKYGGREAYLSGTISKKLHLHARALRLPMPDGSLLEIEAPLPTHMTESWTSLGFDAGSNAGFEVFDDI